MHLVLALLIFLGTFAVINGRQLPGIRLSRPSVVLLGSVAMVCAGILSPAQAWSSINHDTIGLLLGVMILNVHLQRANFFEWAGWHVLRLASSPVRLLHLTVWVAGCFSALLVNDTVCLMLTPLVIRVWLAAELPLLPGLMALSMGANLGSAVTLTGNPQNMIIGQLSQLPFSRFALLSLPAGIVNLLLAGGLLQLTFRSALKAPLNPVPAQPPPVEPVLLRRSVLCLALMVAGFLLNYDLAWTALTAAAVIIPLGKLNPDEVLREVDWQLLLFFCGLFMVMGGLGEAGVVRLLGEAGAPLLQGPPLLASLHLSWMTVLGSQVVSNVPWVLLMGPLLPGTQHQEALWLVLALTSTYAGNLTLMGSVANLIVLEGARNHTQVGFWQWFRVGLPLTLLTTGLGLLILWLVLGLV